MVLGDGHEHERKTSLRLASRGAGIQPGVPPLLGKHGLRAWQSRRIKPGFFAGPGEFYDGILRREFPVLIQFAGQAGALDHLLKL